MNKKNISHNSKEVADRLAEYEQRLKQIAAHKSQLQLYADLINKLSLAKGLDKASYQLVSLLMETLGGTNITLFYDIDGTWHSMDAFRTASVLPCITDTDVQQALIERENIFIDDKVDTHVLKNDRTGGFQFGATWIIPLIVEDEAIGVIKIEGMLVVRPEMMDHLRPFINYSALFLKRLMDNSSVLKIANDKLKKANKELLKEVDTRKKAEEDLQKSEALLKTAGRTARFGGWSADPSGRDLLWSNEVSAIHEMGPGYSPTVDEAIQFYLPEFRNKMAKLFKACALEGTPYDEEMKIFTGSGQSLWVRTTGEAMRDKSGTIIRVHGSFQDITGRKQAEEEKEKLQIQLGQVQKMEAIGTLAGGIAHDFNNILSPIIGYIEMLLDDYPDAGSTRNSLNAIYTGALRARDLVKQILAFARQGQSELNRIKIHPVIKEAMKLIRSTIPTTISIRQHLDPDCGLVTADPTQIHQIVMNLATNAYHAMEENGGELKVNLKEIELGENDLINPDMSPGLYACLTIGDTGVGMNKDVMDRIFDPFFTTKEKGKGTGMGLSVVHGIVKRMNGEIQVQSEPGRGTEFHIYLPVVESASEKQEPKVVEPMRGGCERLLLVDDEEGIIAMEKEVLERLGYQVTPRTGSMEALEAFRSNPEEYDLVITDMSMPKMSGDKLANELIKLRPDIPILLCTGFSEAMTDEKMKSLGFKGILMKPMMMRDLAQKIREILDGSRNA